MADTPERFLSVGIQMAKKVFDLRNKGRDRRTTEAHLSENELAALFALAVEYGATKMSAKTERERIEMTIEGGPRRNSVIHVGPAVDTVIRR